jgi:8-oxo-dGTP diphosphatase
MRGAHCGMVINLTYCPVCGHKLGLREESGRKRPACPNCGYIHYRNPVPGVGLLIEMDGGVVLIQRGHAPHKGEWTLPSGFVEADESAEEAAVREAQEETGLKIELVELAGVNSFPEGPPTSGIIIFFRARPIGGHLHAGDDAANVKVFSPDEMPPLPFRTHREIMAWWLAKQKRATQEIISAQANTNEEPTFIIRPVEVEDTNEVLALLATIPINRGMSDEEFKQAAWRFRELPALEVFVAQSSRQPPMIIGMIALSVVRGLTGGLGVIDDMAVLPTYQRRGVGGALLEAVMKRAHQLNLASLVVNMQRANEHARAFYAASGFTENEMMHFKIR